MKSTNGRGVDLVLNSLAGDLLQASWKCVAKSGKMLEIGKRDMLEHGRLAMDMFENNRTFHGIDLSTMGEEDLVKYGFPVFPSRSCYSKIYELV